MSPISLRAPDGTPAFRSTLVWTGVGFAYWWVFMAALTPGNLQGAGGTVDWGREALRLTVCGLMGAAVTPLLLAAARRLPVERAWLRHGAIQAALVVLLAPAMILASCLIAAWVFEGRALPPATDVVENLEANTLLLMLCLSLFLVAVQVVRRGREAAPAEASTNRIVIEERGRSRVVRLADVDWIQAQGNYQALHVGDVEHLLRETSAALEARLDPAVFARIHRGTIVALDRIEAVTPATNGDASVTLKGGQVLRMSRKYREAVRARLRPDTA